MKAKPSSRKTQTKPQAGSSRRFHIEFKNAPQKLAWAGFQQHDILFLCGPAGVGKSYLAMAFAINEVLQGNKKKIVLTRPVVEAGEKLGFLPGDLNEKLDPYIMPLYDCIYQLVGDNNPQRELINSCIEIAPIAFMRGRTFHDAICIFDEAQNATAKQLKLFLTRLGENSKMIVTGDPTQSDLDEPTVSLSSVIGRLQSVPGIGVIEFKSDSIVRHPLVAAIVNRLGEGI